MKKFLSIMLMMITFALMPTATASEKVKVARLPLIIHSQAKVSQEAMETMELKIARALLISKDKIEHTPKKKSTIALKEIWKDLRSKNPKAKFSDTMELLAKKLNVDIVICTVLYECNEIIHENHLKSNAAVNMMIYDNRTKKLDNKIIKNKYDDVYDKLGTADSLAIDCVIKAIDKTNLQRRI